MEIITQVPVDLWVAIVTLIVNIILAQLSKKYTNISTKLIPLQTMLVGVLVCFIEYIITKDLNTAVMLSGILSGGTYDLVKALKSLAFKEGKHEGN